MCKGNEEFLVEDEASVKEIVDLYREKEGALIPILHEVQEKFGFIPYGAQRVISKETGIPISEIYGVITFYSRFSLKPTGKYKISVCLGTACYVKGSDLVLDKVSELIGIKSGESSADNMYSLEATRCIGACGLAPVMTVNEDVYGKVKPEEVEIILSKYK